MTNYTLQAPPSGWVPGELAKQIANTSTRECSMGHPMIVDRLYVVPSDITGENGLNLRAL
jgi:hypothetical protein